jgi:hypothetical protein
MDIVKGVIGDLEAGDEYTWTTVLNIFVLLNSYTETNIYIVKLYMIPFLFHVFRNLVEARRAPHCIHICSICALCIIIGIPTIFVQDVFFLRISTSVFIISLILLAVLNVVVRMRHFDRQLSMYYKTYGAIMCIAGFILLVFIVYGILLLKSLTTILIHLFTH